MSEAPEMPEVIPLASSEPAPETEAPVTEAVEIAPEPEAAAEAPEPEQPAPEESKKSPVAQLKGRVGYLTKTLHEKDEELARYRTQMEAYKAIAEAAGGDAEAPAPAAGQPARMAPDDFQSAVRTEAQRLAQETAFNDACNQTFEAGKAEFGDDFTEAVSNLNATGLAQRDLIEAALATDAAPKVLHFLGQDLDEAARIAALPAARKGVELAKIAARLNQPAPKPPTSNAPPPITPLGGKASPTLDIYDPDISDEEYWDRRSKQGAPYVRKGAR